MARSRNVLIVSPHFPPVNAPDMQRVRMSLPHFEEFGWKPHVLAVAPDSGDVIESLLSETIPPAVPVERVPALAARITRLAGVRNVALRALPYVYAAGSRRLARGDIDLVYFSTTAFLTMPLGRLWKKRFGTPFVLDFQDPWLSDYYETHPSAPPPAKYAVSRRLNAIAEPWTLAQADGIVAVSPDYATTLQERYPRLRHVPSAIVPFGASGGDFELLQGRPEKNEHFQPGDGRIHGLYAGRGGEDLAPALHVVFRALRAGLASRPDLFGRVALHFVGTSYAAEGRARKTVEPVAAQCGVAASVREQTSRAPYFETLQLLRDADFLMVIGSDDPSYSASKIYPVILARKPLLAILHERSPLVGVLRDTRAGSVTTFSSTSTEPETDAAIARFLADWSRILDDRRPPDTNWTAFEPFTAREATRRQCELFDAVLSRRSAVAA